MKKLSTIIVIFITAVSHSQQVINIRPGGSSTPVDTLSISARINGKQAALVSATNIKTINGQTLLASGDLIVTAAANPEANIYGSAFGSNGFAGTGKFAPKQTLRALDTLINASSLTDVKVGLEGGSIFKGTDGIVVKRGGVTITSYNRDKSGKFHFPRMFGTDVFNTGWTLTGSNTYQQNIPNSVTIATGHYAYVYVIEIDTALEKVDWIAARKYLRYVPSVAAVDTTVGSYYCPSQDPSASPILISMRSSDGIAPNNHPRFRYEVVTRDRAINRDQTLISYGAAMTVENLIAFDYAQGTGPFASRQDSFTMRRCIMGGNTVHQLVCGNWSTITSSAFFEGDTYIPEQVAIVFYQNEGGGATETDLIGNSYFVDVQSVLYSHTAHDGSETSFLRRGRINYWNNYAFNVDYGLKAANTIDTTDMNFSYWKDCGTPIIYNESRFLYVRNTVAENCTNLIYHGTNAVIENTLFRSKRIPSSAFVMSTGHKIDLQHSIIHVKTDTLVGSEGGNVFNNGDSSTMVNAKYNIFVLDIKTGGSGVWATSNNFAGSGQSKQKYDYNVYIKAGAGIGLWKLNDASVNGGDPSVRTLSSWQTLTGQDTHSIFIDLSVYENDLRRIFIDPDNGNYNLANSPQGDSIRAIIDNRGNTPSPAGMRNPLSSFISKPSRLQVVDIIEDDRIPPVSLLFSSGSSNSSFLKDNQTILEKMTKAQRDAIVSPTLGRMIYQTDNTPGPRTFKGSGWFKNTETSD